MSGGVQVQSKIRVVRPEETRPLWAALGRLGLIPLDPKEVERIKIAERERYIQGFFLGRHQRVFEPLSMLMCLAAMAVVVCGSAGTMFGIATSVYSWLMAQPVSFALLGRSGLWMLAGIGVCFLGAALNTAVENIRTSQWQSATLGHYHGDIPAWVVLIMTDLSSEMGSEGPKYYVDYFRHDPFLRVEWGPYGSAEVYYLAKW